MKIGILTLPLHTNYGGILQAYALQTVLERMGHEVDFIEPEKFPRNTWRQKIKNILSKIAFGVGLDSVVTRLHAESFIMIRNTDKFIRRYLHINKYPTISSVTSDSFDAIVVGSDQVWRPMYFGANRMEHAYLAFTDGWDIKRLSYAASFGSDVWELNEEKTRQCKEYVAKFDAVSVREATGVDLCNKYLNVKAEWVLDPTMLLTEVDYNRLLKTSDKKTAYLLTYIIDGDAEKHKVIEYVSVSKNLPIVTSNSKAEDTSGGSFTLKEMIQPPIESWLEGFRDASFIVTDSFHACVFSILYNKQFYVVGNKRRGLARFTSLLSQFGLEDRLVSDVSDIDLTSTIDYKHVNDKLYQLRDKSLNFLKNILN